VRLCQITTPEALREAHRDELVKVRYFTGQRFHAKLYIADDAALVGSANLTQSGLKSNREISVVVPRDEKSCFGDLQESFAGLWESADVLTDSILETFTAAFNSPGKPKIEESIDDHLTKDIPDCDPANVDAGSRIVSKERLFLQNFRRRYDEIMVPAIREIEGVFESLGIRHPTFVNATLDIEISRFLGWLRLTHAPKDMWESTELLSKESRATRIEHYIRLWVETTDVAAGDMYAYETEIQNIARLREVFGSEAGITDADGEDLVEALTGCHAFLEQLRFTKGGEEPLKVEFLADNTADRIKSTLTYLLHGPGDQIQRAYDVIHLPEHKLRKFAESCVMELVGWIDSKRPPINSRTIKALRYLGFNAS
jgi:hypothetical protein